MNAVLAITPSSDPSDPTDRPAQTVVRVLTGAIDRHPARRIDAELVLETIAMVMPEHDFDRVFDAFVLWAQFGSLFDYDQATRTFTRPTPSNDESISATLDGWTA